MSNYITQPFNTVDDLIRCSHGWVYGKCARFLHYCLEAKIQPFTPKQIELMKLGKETHIYWQNYFKKTNPTLQDEIHKTIDVLGKALSGHLDLANDEYAIEIKPNYDFSEYVQTLLYKYLHPTLDFYIWAYIPLKLFQIKADLNMAKIYLARVFLCYHFRPPKLPLQMRGKCKDCYFKAVCDNHGVGDWKQWKRMVDRVIPKL